MATSLQGGSRTKLRSEEHTSELQSPVPNSYAVYLRSEDSGRFRCFTCGYESADVRVVKRIVNELISRWRTA